MTDEIDWSEFLRLQEIECRYAKLLAAAKELIKEHVIGPGIWGDIGIDATAWNEFVEALEEIEENQ